MTHILAAGDHFVLPHLLVDALRGEIGDRHEISTLTLPWPYDPFHSVGEVDEASGSEAEIMAAMPGVEVVVTQMAPFTARVIDTCDALRLIVCSRGGPVNINLRAAARRGVAVCYTPGRNAAAAAEYALGLIIATLRRIPETHATLRAGEWRGDFYAFEESGREIDGSTIGLVGYGAVGSRVARVLLAMGARVLVTDPYVAPAALEPGASLVPLDALLQSCEVVSLHARLSEETRGLIGSKEISRMPRGAVLVNTARGGLLDYDAVVEALESGHLAAAGFDVYPEEPLPATHPLRTCPRVVMTPHLAGATRQTARRAAGLAAAEVARYLRGAPLHHVVNPGRAS